MVGDTYFRATFPVAAAEEPELPTMSPCAGGFSEPFWMRGLSEALVGLGGGEYAGGGRVGGPLPARFYAWASVIVDGRVAATDYAPDAGWLRPSSKAPRIRARFRRRARTRSPRRSTRSERRSPRSS